MTKLYLNIFKILTIAFAAILLASQIYHTLHSPIWRDDAGFAQIAKSLVSGGGYAAVLYDKTYPFYSSLGPVSILPATLMLFFFGNQYWVSGVANMLLIWSLLTAIFVVANGLVGKDRKWLFGFFALALIVLFSIGDNHATESGDKIYIWHLLMGEIPAGLCVILGASLLFFPQASIRRMLCGALFLGFAILTKTITTMAVAVILAAFALKVLREKDLTRLRQIQLIFGIGFCVVAPSIIFELIKIISMGWGHYWEMKANVMDAYKHNALIVTSRKSNGLVAASNVPYQLQLLLSLFGLAGVLLVPVTSYIIYLSYQENRKSPCLLIGTVLMCCFVVHTIWWVRFGLAGAGRHYITALIYYSCGLSFLLASLNYKKLSQLTLGTIIIFVFLLLGVRQGSAEYLFYHGFKGSDESLKEQLMVIEELKKLEQENVTLVACGNNFELEYLLPKIANFKNCQEILEKKFDRPVILVNHLYSKNMILAIKFEQYYGKFEPVTQSILSRCNREYLKTDNFSLLWCKV